MSKKDEKIEKLEASIRLITLWADMLHDSILEGGDTTRALYQCEYIQRVCYKPFAPKESIAVAAAMHHELARMNEKDWAGDGLLSQAREKLD